MENEVGVTKDANKKSEVPNSARKDLKPLILRDISPRSGDFFLNPFRREAAKFFWGVLTSHMDLPPGGDPPLSENIRLKHFCDFFFRLKQNWNFGGIWTTRTVGKR